MLVDPALQRLGVKGFLAYRFLKNFNRICRIYEGCTVLTWDLESKAY